MCVVIILLKATIILELCPQKKWDVRCANIDTCIFCEADCERRSEDFLLKEILLVEEQDDGGVSEPLVVADGVEQF